MVTHLPAMTRRLCIVLVLAAGVWGCRSWPRPSPPPPSQELRYPPVVESTGGVLNLELVAQYARNEIGRDPVELRSYNGSLVGPTLKLKPGDLLRIHLVNRLPRVEGDHQDVVNGPHGLNTTNIHTHGLHVSPSGNSDNPLLKIEPDTDLQYEIQIPPDHPSGTYWYHPHKHGSVAIQVGSGMAGALIITGGIDNAPELAAATDRLFVFQQVPYKLGPDGIGRVEDYEVFEPKEWARSGRYTTINGQIQPTLRLRPGELERWRFVHAGLRESIFASLVECDGGWQPLEGRAPMPLHEIATDGITRYRMVAKNEIELQPAYRSDVLARIETPGNYCLVDNATPPRLSLTRNAETRKVLARVEVRGEPKPTNLPPADISAYAPFAPIEDGELTGRRSALFDVKGIFRVRFLINGQGFDETRVDHSLTLGHVEEWRLESHNGNHPYHIHVNPFQIESGGEKVWKDTILVRESEPVTIRSRYIRYTGKFVLHCHILDHEDRGMMQIVEIQ